MIAEGTPDLQELAPFSGLPVIMRDELQARLRRFVLPPGKCIVQSGKRGHFMAFIGEGLVSLEESDGSLQILAPGQMFGLEMMQYGAPSPYTASALTQTALWVLTRMDWLAAGELAGAKASADAPVPKAIARAPVARMTPAPLPRKPSRYRSWFLAAGALVLAILILYPELQSFAIQKPTGLLLDAGRPDLAETYLKAAANWQPNSAQVHDTLGYSLYLQGEQSEALAAFEQAVSSDPSLASAQNNLGVALLSLSQARSAIDHFQEAAQLDPGSPEAYLNLGNAHLAAGDEDSAAAAYRRAFELDPGQIEARTKWAGIQLKLGQMALARTTWEQILNDRPGNLPALRGLGVLAVLEGNPAQALPYLQAASKADPQDAVTRLYLGVALQALDRLDEAAIEFEQALALSNNPQLKDLAVSYLEGIPE